MKKILFLISSIITINLLSQNCASYTKYMISEDDSIQNKKGICTFCYNSSFFSFSTPTNKYDLYKVNNIFQYDQDSIIHVFISCDDFNNMKRNQITVDIYFKKNKLNDYQIIINYPYNNYAIFFDGKNKIINKEK